MASLRPLIARQFSSLSIYNYRVYFFGQMISLVGTWMQTTAQAWLVLKITGSPFALGAVTTLQFLPITLFTLFGGVFADRLPKRRVLMVTQSIAMAQAFVLGTLVVTGNVQLWHIYLLALTLGTVNAFDGPVRQSFVVELVGRDQLVNAVALNSSIFNVARIIGPAVAGIAIALFGLSLAFFFNAGSFVAVLIAYMLMRPAEFAAAPNRQPKGSVLAQVAEGIKYSWRTPTVLFLFILLAFLGTFGFNFTVVIPLVAEFVLKVGPGKFGLLTSAMGVGSLISALILAALGQASSRVLLAAASAFVLIFAMLALSPWFWLTAGLLVVLGIAAVAFSTTINTSLQLTVPDYLRGRVMSIFFLLFAGSTPVGGWLTGTFAEIIGVRTTLGIEAGICAVGVGVAYAYRLLHNQAFAEAAHARSAEQASLRVHPG